MPDKIKRRDMITVCVLSGIRNVQGKTNRHVYFTEICESLEKLTDGYTNDRSVRGHLGKLVREGMLTREYENEGRLTFVKYRLTQEARTLLDQWSLFTKGKLA